MKDEEINRKIEQSSKDDQYYTDMKIRAVKNTIEENDDNLREDVRPFLWMKKKPRQTLIAFFIFVLICISVASSVDLRQLIAKKFGIELVK